MMAWEPASVPFQLNLPPFEGDVDVALLRPYVERAHAALLTVSTDIGEGEAQRTPDRILLTVLASAREQLEQTRAILSHKVVNPRPMVHDDLDTPEALLEIETDSTIEVDVVPIDLVDCLLVRSCGVLGLLTEGELPPIESRRQVVVASLWAVTGMLGELEAVLDRVSRRPERWAA